ncbi:MAG: glutamate--tRNA ligase family protein [Firmicutes bacterium]|nr:glutamate--tRNA ligase family protein [Bacillota bacterium]
MNILFPYIDKKPEHYLSKYPPRKTTALRMAPSPTGYLHIGSLGMALTCRMLSNQSKGVFYLRIEDTDQKREVVDATERMVAAFNQYGVRFDEGYTFGGNYGPYIQSERTEIYQTFAKNLVERGRAYPCFCTSADLEKTREIQTKNKTDIGYHGQYATCQNLTEAQIKQNITDGKPFAIRLRPSTPAGTRIGWNDPSRGHMELPAIINHPIILKSNGTPPYNFAHVIDDVLMRTSHVVRGEEWLPSTAEHIEIHRAMFDTDPTWAYVHPPVICVDEDGRKRKLSKRKDRHALAETFIENGYPKLALIDYLLTLYNTDYEMWRIENPTAPYADFPFRFEKIGKNSPLFDINKLNHISRNIIARKTKAEINAEVDEYFAGKNIETTKIKAILAVDRETEKPRKDIASYSEILTEYDYLFNRPNVTVEIDPTKGMTMKQKRMLLTGRETGPSLDAIMEILGPKEVAARLK